MKFSSIVRPVLLGCAAALCACATGDAISKVKIFRLDASEPLRAADPAISFEQRHYLHGAITAEEVRAREGNYYTIYFSLADPSQPVTLRFEYRQAGTGSKVLVIEKPIEDPGRSNTTDIAVAGDTFQQNGRVLAWRVSLVRGKQVLASRHSYLWE
jgi:hypothetical protein